MDILLRVGGGRGRGELQTHGNLYLLTTLFIIYRLRHGNRLHDVYII